MLRNVFIVLVLAALAATSAAASPVVPANARKLAHHKAVHSAPVRSAHHGTVRAGNRSSGVHAGHASHATSGNSPRRKPRPSAGRARASRSVQAASRPTLRRASLVRYRALPPSPLKGSFESLARQNERTEADGLERILDEDDLASRIEQKLLVPVPVSSTLGVNSDLVENHRYCRPWTANFLADLAQTHAAQFHKPIEVSSAVRTVEYQQQLMRSNGNAAAAEGDIVSPHLTGGTIDIVKQGMSRQELIWMRNRLLAMQLAGMIDVEEEFRQRCFHVTVYKNYVTPQPDPVPTPRRRRDAPTAQLASDGK